MKEVFDTDYVPLLPDNKPEIFAVGPRDTLVLYTRDGILHVPGSAALARTVHNPDAAQSPYGIVDLPHYRATRGMHGLMGLSPGESVLLGRGSQAQETLGGRFPELNDWPNLSRRHAVLDVMPGELAVTSMGTRGTRAQLFLGRETTHTPADLARLETFVGQNMPFLTHLAAKDVFLGDKLPRALHDLWYAPSYAGSSSMSPEKYLELLRMHAAGRGGFAAGRYITTSMPGLHAPNEPTEWGLLSLNAQPHGLPRVIGSLLPALANRGVDAAVMSAEHVQAAHRQRDNIQIAFRHSDADATTRAVIETYALHSDLFRDETPALMAPVYNPAGDRLSGIAFAQYPNHPDGGSDFGAARCQAIATLLRGHAYTAEHFSEAFSRGFGDVDSANVAFNASNGQAFASMHKYL